jgi:hypothetical protein
MDRVSGSGGSKLISGTGDNTGVGFFGFTVNSDCTLTSMTITNLNDPTSVDASARDTVGIGSTTLKQGAFFCVPEGYRITQIKLASGSVIAYNG